MVKKISGYYRFWGCFSSRRLSSGGPSASPPPASRGMTLLELLAVSVMLSIIVSAVLMLYSQSWTASVKDNEQLTATHIAQYVLEEWLAVQDYQQIKDKMDKSPLTLGSDAVLQEIWTRNTEYPSYTPEIELAYADTDRGAGPIRVTITIESKNKRAVTIHGIKAETTS